MAGKRRADRPARQPGRQAGVVVATNLIFR